MGEIAVIADALAPSSPIAEWHAHLDLQVRAGQMAIVVLILGILSAIGCGVLLIVIAKDKE